MQTVEQIFKSVDNEMKPLEDTIEKIECYKNLLRRCKIRRASLYGFVNDENRIDNLRRAELRIEGIITKLGRKL